MPSVGFPLITSGWKEPIKDKHLPDSGNGPGEGSPPYGPRASAPSPFYRNDGSGASLGGMSSLG